MSPSLQFTSHVRVSLLSEAKRVFRVFCCRPAKESPSPSPPCLTATRTLSCSNTEGSSDTLLGLCSERTAAPWHLMSSSWTRKAHRAGLASPDFSGTSVLRPPQLLNHYTQLFQHLKGHPFSSEDHPGSRKMVTVTQ